MNAAQKNLVRETVAILRDLEAVGTEQAATVARELVARTHRMLADLGPVDVAELLAEQAAA